MAEPAEPSVSGGDGRSAVSTGISRQVFRASTHDPAGGNSVLYTILYTDIHLAH